MVQGTIGFILCSIEQVSKTIIEEVNGRNDLEITNSWNHMFSIWFPTAKVNTTVLRKWMDGMEGTIRKYRIQEIICFHKVCIWKVGVLSSPRFPSPSLSSPHSMSPGSTLRTTTCFNEHWFYIAHTNNSKHAEHGEHETLLFLIIQIIQYLLEGRGRHVRVITSNYMKLQVIPVITCNYRQLPVIHCNYR